MEEYAPIPRDYSDLEYSDPDSDESDFDPADITFPNAENPAVLDDSAETPFQDATLEDVAGNKLPQTPYGLKVFKIIEFIAAQGLTLAGFLDAISWGDTDCTLNAAIRNARTRFLNSPQLPAILRRWQKPPRPAKSKHVRPKGARDVMEKFALECAQEILEKELELLADIFESPAGEDIKEEHLVGISFPTTVKLAKKRAPNLWATLFQLAGTAS
jgi:hypothetical protein